MRRLSREPPVANQHPRANMSGRLSLAWGTDWPLPDKGEPKDVLLATQKIFLLPGLRDHYADYFSGNAKQFLKKP